VSTTVSVSWFFGCFALGGLRFVSFFADLGVPIVKNGVPIVSLGVVQVIENATLCQIVSFFWNRGDPERELKIFCVGAKAKKKINAREGYIFHIFSDNLTRYTPPLALQTQKTQ